MSVEHSIYRLHWRRVWPALHIANTERGTYTVEPVEGGWQLTLPSRDTAQYERLSDAKLAAEQHYELS